jgi:CubicO group peptidase (beta-lactamase class C family)
MTRRLSALAVIITAVPAIAADTKPDLAAKCDAYMKARAKYSATKFSGAVLVGKDGKIVYENGFGLANREYDVPNTPKTRFRLASVSKQFTATGIMILEHEGKLKVEDPISKYVEVPEAWAKVTLHQLLSHTSGVPENLRPALFKGMWGQPIDKDHLLDHLKKAPLDFKPGEKWSYSNTGYALLGMTIEKVSGKPYDEFLKERIFEPLAMKDSGVDTRKLVLKNRAEGYGMSKSEYIHAQYIDLSQVFSAGSMFSTVEDMLKWDSALYTEKILPRKSLERMWTPVKNDYGYGWLSIKMVGHKTIVHDGGLPGFVTTVMRFPDDKVYVAALCNLEGSAVPKTARDLAAIVLGEPYDVPVDRKEAKLDSKMLDGLVGEYEVRPAKVEKWLLFGDVQVRPAQLFKVTLDGDELYAQVPGQGRFRIRPESDTVFFAPPQEIVVTFGKDDAGKIRDVTVHQNGRDTKAKRRESAAAEKKDEAPKKADGGAKK